MSTPAPSPLAMPVTWDLVARAYAEEVVPMFERYADEALARTGVARGARVVDVATGPGTLAVLAARRGIVVDALDFSPEMLATLRARLARDNVENVTVHQGDGMSLPFGDGAFDAGFSMFGLFMFPDRARGFAELRRVLRPGARSAVSSWQPFVRAPMLDTLFAVLKELMPNLPFGDAKAPLGDQAEFRDEMTSAGFGGVEVVEVVNAFPVPSTDEFIGSLERTCAPLALLSKSMGDKWSPVRERLRDRLVERVGQGPHDVSMPAWLGVGTR